MAKVRICDHCGKIVEDKHTVHFREYYIGAEIEFGFVFPVKSSKVEKIDLCEDCYSSLISMKKPAEELKEEAKDDE